MTLWISKMPMEVVRSVSMPSNDPARLRGMAMKSPGSAMLIQRRTPGGQRPLPFVGTGSRWGKTTSGRARGDQQVDLQVGVGPEGFVGDDGPQDVP